MEQETLQELGFTRAEAKVYIVLLKLGSVKVGQIIEKTGLQSSTTHNTIHSLIEKGYINYVLKGKIKLYQTVEPKIILERYQEKVKKLQEDLPKLKAIQNITKEKQSAEIYEGVKGIITLLNELIEDSKPNDEYYFFAIDVSGMNKEIQDFFERYDAKRKASKLSIRGLARKELRPLFQKRKFLNVKYLDFPIPSNISICNDKMILISWGERPNGIMIKSKQIIESEKEFFKELWKKASK